MDRRTFVQLGTTTILAIPSLGLSAFTEAPVKPEWLIKWIKLNDEVLPKLDELRITDASSEAFGGLKDNDDIPNPHSTTSFLQRASWAISTPESTFYQSKELLQKMNLALQFLLKIQHEDGTIDLLSTNFHSTPDTGFIVKYLGPSYILMARAKVMDSEAVMQVFEKFLKRAGEALIVGGIHTPNHRWVVSAALAKLNEIWPDRRYVKRAEEWLAEHIDVDADGQYNEHSTYIYSPLSNRVLITIAKGLRKPELLQHVRKNLLMTRYYVHPNGEVVTEASGRQDRAVVGTLEGYYYPCRYMALHDNDGDMAAMCRLIEQTAGNRIAGYLGYFLEDPSLWRELPDSKSIPTDYAKPFVHSGLVRIRRGNWDATILSKNATCLSFHRGEAVLQGMRVAASFFGKGQFQTDKIEQKEGKWVLTQSLEGPYYQPFRKECIDPKGDWKLMPQSERSKSEVQRLTTVITIGETEGRGGLTIEIEIAGTAGVPVALELIFRQGGTFTGVMPHPNKANTYLFGEQTGAYTFKNDTIKFSTGKAQHKNTQLRGALPATDLPTVYLTGFTPFKHSLQLS